MAGFLYFFPGRARGDAVAAALAAGLGYALADGVESRGTGSGPGDGPGQILVPAGSLSSDRVAFARDDQTWGLVHGADGWVGFWTDNPPTPDDLWRDDGLPGHPIELTDGRTWEIPVAQRLITGGDEPYYRTAVPQTVTRNGRGWKPGPPVPAWRDLWDVGVRWWDAVAGAMGALETEPGDGRAAAARESALVVPFDTLIDDAILVLGKNYRIGPSEVDLMGLLTEDHARRILDLVIDRPTSEAWFKKKMGSGS